MPARRPPTSFTAARDLTIAGVLVRRNADVPLAQAAALGQQLGPLVNRGVLRPNPSQYPETARRQTSWQQRRMWAPYYLNPRETRAL